MADSEGSNWVARLPWVLLGLRTTYQADLKSTSAELVLGTNPIIPGDLIGEPSPEVSSRQLESLLESLRQRAAQPATQTSSHGIPPVNVPTNLDQVSHVRIKRHKLNPLQHAYEGPFPIIERVGKACIRVRVGSYADGRPRTELHHWENAKPAVLSPSTVVAERGPLGRKPNVPSTTTETNNQMNLDNNNNERPKRNVRPPERYSA